jgi:hypothetical protein
MTSSKPLLSTTMVVEAWWGMLLRRGYQIDTNKPHDADLVRPRGMGREWKEKVHVDLLFDEFSDFVTDQFKDLVFNIRINKQAFYTVFYGLSGARKIQVRVDTERMHFVKFHSLRDHRERYDESYKVQYKTGGANARMVEQENHQGIAN